MIPSFLVSKWSGSFPFHPSLPHPLPYTLKPNRQLERVGGKLRRMQERMGRLARVTTFSRRKWMRSSVQVEGLLLDRSKVQFIHSCQMERTIFRHCCCCMGTCGNGNSSSPLIAYIFLAHETEDCGRGSEGFEGKTRK